MAGSNLVRVGRRRRSSSRLGTALNAKPDADLEFAPAGGRRINWAKLPSLALLVGSLWLIYTLFGGHRFRVSRVTIGGTSLVERGEVRRLVNADGANIFRIDAKGVAARLKEEFGCIERAVVRCRLPNEVTVSVTEREALLVWESGGRYWWLDVQGNVLGATDGPGELVVIHDLGQVAPEPEGYVVGCPWELAHEMMDALPAARDYDFTRQQGLIVYVTANRWPVYLGHKGHGPTKIAILRSLVDSVTRKGIDVEYIDLRNERRPTYKKRRA